MPSNELVSGRIHRVLLGLIAASLVLPLELITHIIDIPLDRLGSNFDRTRRVSASFDRVEDLLEPIERRPGMRRSQFRSGRKPAYATPIPEPGHDHPFSISSTVKRPFSWAHSLASGLRKAGGGRTPRGAGRAEACPYRTLGQI